jgi:hypothetical protein
VNASLGCLEGEGATGRDAHRECGAVCLLHQRPEVVHLARGGVVRRIAALAAPAPIVGEYREMFGENRGKLRRGAVVAIAERAVHDDYRRPSSESCVRDLGSVRRPYCSIHTDLPYRVLLESENEVRGEHARDDDEGTDSFSTPGLHRSS